MIKMLQCKHATFGLHSTVFGRGCRRLGAVSRPVILAVVACLCAEQTLTDGHLFNAALGEYDEEFITSWLP